MAKMNNPYHTPVLFEESVTALNIDSESVVVDATFGGGGHGKEILNRLGDEGLLMAFDQDEDAKENRPDDERLLFVDSNFRYLINFAKYYELDGEIDAVFADLGVSSHQFDVAERGFSIRMEGELDMRMNQESKLTAKKVVNDYSEEELLSILRKYADIQGAKKVARVLVQKRQEKPIRTTSQLVDILDPLAPRNHRKQFLAQVFQAIRIEVNDEMGALRDFLEQSLKVLKKGGRLVVISYHSIEDRLVKNFMRTGNFEGEFEKDDVFGVARTPFNVITKKPIVPTDEEVERNPRARSAKLRIAEKL